MRLISDDASVQIHIQVQGHAPQAVPFNNRMVTAWKILLRKDLAGVLVYLVCMVFRVAVRHQYSILCS
jgi:hypothetical protein